MSQGIPPGVDPRTVFPGHRERGPRRWWYTYDAIAAASGMARSTVSAARWAGDLKSVSLYVARQLASRSKFLGAEETVGWLDGMGRAAQLPMWENRWPRLALYACPGCAAVGLQQGFCRKCGGVYPMWEFDTSLHFVLRLGRVRTAYHRLVLPVPGMDIHHKDYNRWNNRPENLLPMTHSDHWRLHQQQQRPDLVGKP